VSETRSQQAFSFAEQARASEDEQGRLMRPQRAREQKKKQNGDAGNRTRVEEKGHSRPTCVVHVILHMRARARGQRNAHMICIDFGGHRDR